MEWFESLGAFERVFFYMALPSTLILVIQTVLLLIGIGHGPEADTSGFDGHDAQDFGGNDAHDFDEASHPVDHYDMPDSGLRVFTVRGIVAFFTICGWSGLAMAASGTAPFLTVLLSIVFGALALVGIALIFKASLKLQQAGNINMVNAIDKVGQVYIPIPSSSSGVGKIMIEVQGRFIEADAITKQPLPLSTGASVKVTGLLNDTLIVVPFELE